MKVGFSGTRHGMTDPQKEAFRVLLCRLGVSEFCHGDCKGSDDEAAGIVEMVMPRERIHVRPGPDSEWRAHHVRTGNIVYPAKGHFTRNRDIAQWCTVLIATPLGEVLGTVGGTAYTVHYARKIGKRCIIIYPNGTIEGETP